MGAEPGREKDSNNENIVPTHYFLVKISYILRYIWVFE